MSFSPSLPPACAWDPFPTEQGAGAEGCSRLQSLHEGWLPSDALQNVSYLQVGEGPRQGDITWWTVHVCAGVLVTSVAFVVMNRNKGQGSTSRWALQPIFVLLMRLLVVKAGGGDAASLLDGKGRFRHDVLYLRKEMGSLGTPRAPFTAEMHGQTQPSVRRIPIKTSLEAHLEMGHGEGSCVA